MPFSRSRSKSPARTPKRSPARSPTRSPTRSPKKVTVSAGSDDSEFARSLLGFAVGTIVFAATLSFGLVTSAMLPVRYRGVDVVAHQEQLEANALRRSPQDLLEPTSPTISTMLPVLY